MNQCTFIGRLTTDPEMKVTNSGKKIANFTLAVGRKFNKDEADFIRCQAWENTAKVVESYCHKGDILAANGELRTGSYVDNQGTRRNVTFVNLSDVQLLPQGSKSTAHDAPVSFEPVDRDKDFEPIDDEEDPF